MHKLIRRFQYWRQRGRLDNELAEEMEFHRAMLASDGKEAAVMGSVTMAREDARAVWIWPWLQSVWQDLAYGARTLRRSPGFTITALVALGCAIGINTSLFTIFNAFALRPWPARDAERVVVAHRMTGHGMSDFGIAEYRFLAQHATSFSGLIAIRSGEMVKLDDRKLALTYVSGNYFQVMGIALERGRGFSGESEAGAVISHDLWQNGFGGDPGIVGKPVRLDDAPFTVVGVAPAELNAMNGPPYSLRNDAWVTLPARKLLRPNDPSVDAWLTRPSDCCTPIAGRLAPGVGRAAAAAELTALSEQFQAANGLQRENSRVVVAGTAWIESPRKKRQVIPMMAALFLAVTLVLALACANVGNLLLARAASRRQEIAVRLSLGASRARLVRQFLVESLMLAVGAAAAGLAIAEVLPGALLRRLAGDLVIRIVPDGRVLAYTMVISIVSCLAFGLAPALHGTRGSISVALKSRPPRLRSLLLAVQVAISVVLLSNAALLVRGIQRAQATDLGFDVKNVSVLSLELPASQYGGARSAALARDLEAALRGARDLPVWGLATSAPLAGSHFSTSFRLPEDGSRVLQIDANDVSSGYFDALGIPLVAGRKFAAEDAGHEVAMVNAAAVRRWWSGASPVGKTFVSNEKVWTVVGVVGDAYTNDLTGLEAMLYFPLSATSGVPTVLVRDGQAAVTARVASIVRAIEPRAQVTVEPMAARVGRGLLPSTVGAEIAGFLGLLAMGIASVGMFGVFAYAAGQRTREIGVRMALGARPSEIVRLVLGSSLVSLGFGAVAGIAAAVASSILLANALPGVKTGDPAAYVAVVVLLAAAVALASAIPARRATRVDPVRALRWE
jgi:macrolide transport system ATP-binding/permease protein